MTFWFTENRRISAALYEAYNFGIGMVYQHFTLVPAMTVAENLLARRPDMPGMINWKSGDGTAFARS